MLSEFDFGFIILFVSISYVFDFVKLGVYYYYVSVELDGCDFFIY